MFWGKHSLDDLEHGVIRKQFKSLQIHFALVCGARGCPPLCAEFYTAVRLEIQFTEQSRTFFSDAHKNRIDHDAKSVRLSPIFKRYTEVLGVLSGAYCVSLRRT